MWEFLCVVRRTFQSDDNWGELFIKNQNGRWEWLCYTYELPWKTVESGPNKGLSQSKHSRIKMGVYTLSPRQDGPKGWRLDLENTGHRSNIQIHRAHTSMYIEGCILPVSFNNFSKDKLEKGDPLIQTRSIDLMTKIKSRYELLKVGKKGKETVVIEAKLPASLVGYMRA